MCNAPVICLDVDLGVACDYGCVCYLLVSLQTNTFIKCMCHLLLSPNSPNIIISQSRIET